MTAVLEQTFSDASGPLRYEQEPGHAGKQKGGYIPTLDGWRGIAILGVMIAHNHAIFEGHDRLTWLACRGGWGVEIFFGLSGLLITSRLLRERTKTGGISLKSFYIRRVFRILPPYFLYLGVIALMQAQGLFSVSRAEWAGVILFVRNYIPLSWVSAGFGGWSVGHFWTLSVEEHFYLILPAIVVFFATRQLKWVLATFALGVAVWGNLDIRYGILTARIPDIYYPNRTDHRIDALLWGAFLAVLLNEAAMRIFLRKLLHPGIWFALVVFFVLNTLVHLPLSKTWSGLCIAILLAGTILNPDGIVGRALEWAPLRWVGRLSYSLYIWQQMFLVGSGIPRPLPLGAIQRFPLNIVGAFAAAIASYYLVERFFLKLGYRLSTSASWLGRRDVIPTGAEIPV